MGESPGKMYAMATVLTILAMVAIGLRFYARRIKHTQLSWDDYMILPAMFFTIGTAICMYIGAAIGDLGRHTAIDDTGYPIFTHRTEVFEQINYASQLTTTLTLAFTKLAVLLLYRRVFQGESFKKAMWFMFAVISVWTVGFFFSNLLQCWPINMNWTDFGGSYDYCINTNEMYLYQAWSDIFTDLAILAMPLPCIWALQMKTKHKVGVSAIFLLGLLTVGAGVAKLVVLKHIIWVADNGITGEFGAADVSYLLTPAIYWPMVESSLGIVGACLPLLRPLFTGASSKGFMRKLRHVHVHTIPSSPDPNSSQGTGSTVVGSVKVSSNKHVSQNSCNELKRNVSGATYNEHYACGLNTHGLFDDVDESDEYVERDLERDSEKDFKKGHTKDKSISCVTEISVSSHGRRRADDNV